MDHGIKSAVEDVEETMSDAGYGRAMLIGLIIGWTLVPLVVVFMAFVGAPDAGWPMWLGVAAMVALWAGLFLGGVFTISAYQMRLERTSHGTHGAAESGSGSEQPSEEASTATSAEPEPAATAES